MSHLSQLIVADEDVSVFEWCIFKILRYNLDADTNMNKRALISIQQDGHVKRYYQC